MITNDDGSKTNFRIKPPNKRIDSYDLAWCAGLYEGEGTVSATDHSIQASLVSTDLDVLEELCRRMGVGGIRGPMSPSDIGKKPYYRWEVSSRDAIFAMKSIRPWLKERRTAQVDRAIERYENRPIKTLRCPEDWHTIMRMQHEGVAVPSIAEAMRTSPRNVKRVVKQAKECGVESPTYIAGPMSGYPEGNYAAFEEMAARLRQAGVTVISPHELHPFDNTRTWEWFMRRDLAELAGKCVRVVMLPGWEKSRGAALEHRVATDFGMEIVYDVDEWLKNRGGSDE